jgi:hypothetical protein
MSIHHLPTFNSSPEAPLPLQIMATTWPPADEIDTYNADLIVAIIEVIAGNTIPEKSSDFDGRFI